VFLLAICRCVLLGAQWAGWSRILPTSEYDAKVFKTVISWNNWRLLRHTKLCRVWVYGDNWNTFVKHSTRASNQRTGILKGLIHYPYLSDIEDNSRGLDLFISHFSIQSLLTGKLCFKIEDGGINSTRLLPHAKLYWLALKGIITKTWLQWSNMG